jgi:hypothetical protein
MKDWRQDLLEKDPTLCESHKRILRDGAKQLSDAWVLGALKRKYKKEFESEI